MKKMIFKIALGVLGVSILISGCAATQDSNKEINIKSKKTYSFYPIPPNCIDGFKNMKAELKREKEIGYFMEVTVCQINDNLIKFKQINTIENLDEVLSSVKKEEELPYYNCDTKEAKKEKYKRASICKRNDGLSELVIISPII